MPGTIQVILAGILPLTANGSLELRKEPPFRVLTPGWAAVATVDLERDVPRVRAVFNLMARHPNESVPMIVGYRGRWIIGDAFCVDRSLIHRGQKYTLAFARFDWSTPCRLSDVARRKRAA